MRLRVGDEHSVRLSGVPTAGYRWAPEVEGAGDVAEVSHAGTEVPSGGAVGGGAQERFTIRALQPGVTKVRFTRRRAWEPDDQPPGAEHVVELHVVDAPDADGGG